MRENERNLKDTAVLSLLSVPVGAVAGFGAVGFRYLIAFFHKLFFYGELSFHYASEEPFISPWGSLVVFVPAVGLLLANWMTEKWAPEAKGHGVPEVMSAVMENRGVIRPVVSIVKSFASAITIGSGGSVGREGPIVQIGASFGSSLGQLCRLSSRDVIILLGAGVAGGIGATFNAPIGGIIFALELVLPEYSIMTIMPLVVSSIIATHISTLILGVSPAFVLPMYSFVSSTELLFYIFLGLVAGLTAIAFIHTLYASEDFFNRLRLPSWLKALVGGLLLGIIALICLKLFGQYYLFGVGYAFLTEVLSSNLPVLGVLIALVVLKIIANSLTLAAGGSGGIFAPSLFLGAAVGALVGLSANAIAPGATAHPSAYAIVGMAAMVAGTTGASLTSIIMIFEMTRNYHIMLPLMLSVVIAHFITALIYKETIYTKKLSRRGIRIQLDKRIPILKSLSLGDIAKTKMRSVSIDATVAEVVRTMHELSVALLPVFDGDALVGTISYPDIYPCPSQDQSIRTFVVQRDICADADDDLYEALDHMKRLGSNLLLVRKGEHIIGYVSKTGIMDSYLSKRERL